MPVCTQKQFENRNKCVGTGKGGPGGEGVQEGKESRRKGDPGEKWVQEGRGSRRKVGPRGKGVQEKSGSKREGGIFLTKKE